MDATYKKNKAHGMDSEATQVLCSAATWLRKAAGHPEEEEEAEAEEVEEEEEEQDAAGTVDTLSNKANHSAVVLFCYNSILIICFHFYVELI